ncbi:cupin domain-containing protein [Sphingobacterium kitahiroshimense]|uniref:Cupin domain-containing protein n=1 Tax=Sphingobacterium kitahiroshimense TaxID=470446 RepID=A0ABV0BWD8_9SPHI
MIKRTRSNLFFLSLFSVAYSCSDPVIEDPKNGYSDKIEMTTLLKSTSSWDGTVYSSYLSGQPEISILKIAIPPNRNLDWHKHPVINAAYVLKGEMQIEKKEDGEIKWISEGQAVPEVVNTVHRGKTGEKGVTLIVFYSGVTGSPISESVQDIAGGDGGILAE